MDRLGGPARLMIVSDLDHTMVDHHDLENLSLLRFNALWESNYRHNSLLIFSTGRSPALFKELRKEKPLLTPDIAIMSVGTEITYGDLMVPDNGWDNVLNEKWNRGIVVEESSKIPQLSFQPATEQRPHKVSFHVQKEEATVVISSLYKILANRGLDVKIIYSGGIDLDILPQGAGKGQALAYLLKKLKSNDKLPLNTLVCGDSGNDAELFSIPEVHGVMVSNAQEELLKWHEENAKDNTKIFHASQRCASGIIEAIGHFELGSNISPRDVEDLSTCKLDIFNPGHELVLFYLLYERWRREEVEHSSATIDIMKKITFHNGVLIHPSGTERPFHECIDAFAASYGDKKGKRFQTWLDRVSSSQICPDTWLVKFDKWEMSDEGRQCCLMTFLLNTKADTPEGLMLIHAHQTWMEGYAGGHQNTWFF